MEGAENARGREKRGEQRYGRTTVALDVQLFRFNPAGRVVALFSQE